MLRNEAKARLARARELYREGKVSLDDIAVRRVHLLPNRDISLVSSKDADIELPLGDDDYRLNLVIEMQEAIDAKGQTLAPVRLNHEPGGKGWVLDVEVTERGIDAILVCVPGPWLAENPYVSGHWALEWRESDERWHVTELYEITHTDMPQFRHNQEAPSTIAVDTSESGSERVAASFTYRGHTMTPEEIKAMIQEMLDAMRAGLEESLEARFASLAAAQDDEEEDAEDEEEEEVEAEAAPAEEEEDGEASLAASLKLLAQELAAMRKGKGTMNATVAASLTGRVATGEKTVPTTFPDRIMHYRNQGHTEAESLDLALRPQH